MTLPAGTGMTPPESKVIVSPTVEVPTAMKPTCGVISGALILIATFTSYEPQVANAQDQIRRGQWQIELSGGASVPIGRFDERTFEVYGGARTGVHLGVATFRKFSNSMTLGLGVNYFRFSSDLVGMYPQSPYSGNDHSAVGGLFSVEPTWRWYIFSSRIGKKRPFMAFAPIITWGEFTVSHLYSPPLMPPGTNEINAAVDRDVALGTMFGVGLDLPLAKSWLTTVMISHRHTPKTEANGPFDSGYSVGYSYDHAYFNTTWVDFTVAIKRPL